MLSAVERRARRTPRSLRSEYEEFIEQRIEEYKDGLPRASILGIGDEAVQELARTEQYTLTEVLLQEQVDSIIRRRLRLPSYRRWRERHLALRAAPRSWWATPTSPRSRGSRTAPSPSNSAAASSASSSRWRRGRRIAP